MTTNGPDPDQLIPIAEAARITGLHGQTIREAVAAGRIPRHRFGDVLAIRRGDLHIYLASRKRAIPKTLPADYPTPAGMEPIVPHVPRRPAASRRGYVARSEQSEQREEKSE
jgi:excisionase family DNA binding protein